MLHDSDIELFHLISEGDQQAFSTCVYRFTPRLLPYIRSYVKAEVWAEDVMQDLWIKIWNSRKELMAIENPAGYLIRTAHNLALDNLRNNSLHAKLEYQIAEAIHSSRFW